MPLEMHANQFSISYVYTCAGAIVTFFLPNYPKPAENSIL